MTYWHGLPTSLSSPSHSPSPLCLSPWPIKMPCYLSFFRNLHVAPHLSPANSHSYAFLQTPWGILYTYCSYSPSFVYFLPTSLKLALPPYIETAALRVTTIWIPHRSVFCLSSKPHCLNKWLPRSLLLSAFHFWLPQISDFWDCLLLDRACLLSPLLSSPLCLSSSFPLSLSSTWQPRWHSQNFCTCLYLYLTIFSSVPWLNPTYTISTPKCISPT